jgi:hypothetical protein
MIIYVSIISWGFDDDRDKAILYVGIDHDKALKKINDTCFPNTYNNFAWIEYWQDGKEIKHEEIDV